MQDIWLRVTQVLGLEANTLTVWHMAVRAVVVYIAALGMVRIGEKRFLGKNTAFDVILGIILGSVVSRAITGSAEFFPTLAAGVVLVLMHWLIAVISFRSDWFGTVVKGQNRLLVEHGEIRWNAMQKSHISKQDLMSALRHETGLTELDDIKEARLERSGDVSFIKGQSQPRILEVNVADGVQTVRIEVS